MLIIDVDTYDELKQYLRDEKYKFYNTLVSEIQYSYENDIRIAQIAKAELINGACIIINIADEDWVFTLNKCISFYETIEEYETCTKIQQLIKDINASELGII